MLDPCMGSGHFLAFALPILARMRQEEEGLSLSEAVHATFLRRIFSDWSWMRDAARLPRSTWH